MVGVPRGCQLDQVLHTSLARTCVSGYELPRPRPEVDLAHGGVYYQVRSKVMFFEEDTCFGKQMLGAGAVVRSTLLGLIAHSLV